MTPHYEQLIQLLKGLPGLGYRSAERIALHLLVEKTEQTKVLIDSLSKASDEIGPCGGCGNLTESQRCNICESSERDDSMVCVIESVPDLFAMERSAAYRGKYHVLHGKLSPVRGVGPERLNLDSLREKIESGIVEEVILALGNDMEGEATCYYIMQEILEGRSLRVSRIGFGLPSGGGLTYADETTLRSAMEGRQTMR